MLTMSNYFCKIKGLEVKRGETSRSKTAQEVYNNKN